MKVLFLYPNKIMVTRLPLGITYLSAYLKNAGHQTKVFDTTFIKCGNFMNDEELRASSLQVRNPDLKAYGLLEKDADVSTEFKRQVDLFKPDLIAMSAVDPNYEFGLQLLKDLKVDHKGIKTIVGGATATFAPDEVILHDCVDMVGIGECEDAIVELCDKLEAGDDICHIENIWVKEGSKIHTNKARGLKDVNDILLPDWDIFDQRHILRPLGGKMYRMGLFYMSRGCLFRCKYCANFALHDMYKDSTLYRIKKPQLLVDEIKLYKEKYDLNFVFFIDDLFPLHKKDILDTFCSIYKKEIQLPFTVNLHPELIAEESFAKLVDAGCRNICVGLESGNDNIRRSVLGRAYKNEQVINVFKLAKKYKIRSSSFNMIGIPQETRKNIFETIKLNRQAMPTTTTLTFAHPYRGTELRKVCIKEGFYDLAREKEYENLYRMESQLSLPEISNRELRGLFKTFQLYIRFPKIFYILIKIAEGDLFFSKFVFNRLKTMFYWVTKKDAYWDFSKVN